MSVLQAPHAADLRIIYQMLLVEKLLDWFDSSGQKTAFVLVLSLAILAVRTELRWAFVDHVTPFVALIADGSLRASICMVIS